MTDTKILSFVKQFTKEQLRAIDSVLRILDPDEYRDYHDQFGICNAPDRIELLRSEIRAALRKS
ncbi:MAG: hypothetical protein AM326_11105 [Candidatus Thorarchaeota archaeon SMTZ-45]|nr:MAG: hypothetical protein AM326_11105 [Candidatus Thorarchaeota archaeon SMTZ-45]KXH73789.1 MAG: hypothetical protein AM325_07200 [Candidatus Thorarchaeota archaeon SMTZ1-45]